LKSKLLKKLFGLGAIRNVAGTTAAGLSGILGTGYGLNKLNEANKGKHHSKMFGPKWLRNLASWWKFDSPDWFPWGGGATRNAWKKALNSFKDGEGNKRYPIGVLDSGEVIFEDTKIYGDPPNPDNYFDFPMKGLAGQLYPDSKDLTDPDRVRWPMDSAQRERPVPKAFEKYHVQPEREAQTEALKFQEQLRRSDEEVHGIDGLSVYRALDADKWD